jgi:hypothetical protein
VPQEGYLHHVAVTDLDVSLGNIDANIHSTSLSEISSLEQSYTPVIFVLAEGLGTAFDHLPGADVGHGLEVNV